MPSPEKQAVYNETYRQQLKEILTGYGPMFEMWFDGGNIVPINDLIGRYAPGIISFQGEPRRPRWVGTSTVLRLIRAGTRSRGSPARRPKKARGAPLRNSGVPRNATSPSCVPTGSGVKAVITRVGQ